MPPNKQSARDGEDHASVLGIFEARSTSENTEIVEIVNSGAPETALAFAMRLAIARKAMRT